MSECGSGLEQAFFALWTMQEGVERPPPVRQYRFREDRRWTLDFAWPEVGIAVEICGVNRMTKYRRAEGITAYVDKLNAAIEDGWSVMQFTSLHMKREPQQCVEQVAGVLAVYYELIGPVEGRPLISVPQPKTAQQRTLINQSTDQPETM